MFFSSLGDIAAIFAYMAVINLAESISVLLAPVILSILLPQKWFYDRFVSRSVSLILLGLSFLMYVNYKFDVAGDVFYPLVGFRWTLCVLATILALVYLIDRIGLLRKLLEAFANQAVIFLYISIPLSAISLVVVLIRNVF